jgi:hypothetical protein
MYSTASGRGCLSAVVLEFSRNAGVDMYWRKAVYMYMYKASSRGCLSATVPETGICIPGKPLLLDTNYLP